MIRLRNLSSFVRIIPQEISVERCFHSTPLALAEPPKKRLRVDAQTMQARLDRKKRKLEKEIEQLLKVTNKPKPVEELRLPFDIEKHVDKHKRQSPVVSEEELNRRALLAKEWSRFKLIQYRMEMRRVNAMNKAQVHALNQLKMVSEDLYQAAIQPYDGLLPFSRRGPSETPPIEGYVPPDGDYIDTTRKYED